MTTAAGTCRRLFMATTVIVTAGGLAGLTHAAACPFCTVVGRPLAARRDAALVVAVGEAVGPARDEAGIVRQRFIVRGVLRGDAAENDIVTARVAGAVAGTALLLAAGPGADGFEAIAADEGVLGHVAAAPATGVPAARRLEWFAGRLEHPQRVIAEDAFAEFGLAEYADVVAAAGALDASALQDWVAEPGIDPRRRGFYGLALGIVAARARAAGDAVEADACRSALERAILAPGSDLRAGHDGLLGGLLVARGESALDWLADHGFLAADTRPGDARHALAALRFAWEELPPAVPRDRVAAAAARLLANPAVAADAVIDLARWRHWRSVDDVAALWDRLGRDDPLLRRAVAGYLSACPLEPARQWAGRIAAAHPEAWAAAIRASSLPPRAGD